MPGVGRGRSPNQLHRSRLAPISGRIPVFCKIQDGGARCGAATEHSPRRQPWDQVAPHQSRRAATEAGGGRFLSPRTGLAFPPPLLYPRLAPWANLRRHSVAEDQVDAVHDARNWYARVASGSRCFLLSKSRAAALLITGKWGNSNHPLMRDQYSKVAKTGG